MRPLIENGLPLMKRPKTTLWLSYKDAAEEGQSPEELALWLIEQLGEPVKALPFLDPNRLHVKTDHQCLEIELFRGDFEEGHYAGPLCPAEGLRFAIALMSPFYSACENSEVSFNDVPCIHPSLCKHVAPTCCYKLSKQAMLWTAGILGGGLIAPMLKPRNSWLLRLPQLPEILVRPTYSNGDWEISLKNTRLAIGSDLKLLLSKAAGVLITTHMGKRIVVPEEKKRKTRLRH